MTIRFSKLRSDLRKYSSLLWIMINAVGFYIVNLNYVGYRLQNQHLHPTLMLIYIIIVSPLISGLIFGFFQISYIKMFCKTQQLPFWALKTSLSFFLIGLLNGNLPNLLLHPIIWKVVGINYSYSSNFYSGIVVTGPSDMVAKIFIAIFLGILMGLWSGFILGFFPALSFADKKLAREWILRVTISGWISFIVNSVYYTIAFSLNPTGIYLVELYRNGLIITGLLYGLLTIKPMEQLLFKNSN